VIVTQKKDFNEVLESLKANGLNKIIVIGCASCATKCATGGEDQVQQMTALLKENGVKVIASRTLEEPCDMRLTKRDFREFQKEHPEVNDADGALVMSCGLGCQAFQQVTGKLVVPANNTVFMGVTERLGVYHEYCKSCGHCYLGETGGICPISRCAKGLVNGPCGGCQEGKCEYGGYKNDCAWTLIYNKLKESNRLSQFMVFHPPKNYLLFNSPRNVPPTWTIEAPKKEQ
jgi:Methylene-tetrahydrofolate reductase C terminal